MAGQAAWLDTVYDTMLYGGATLNDSMGDGSQDSLDKGEGGAFDEMADVDMLFTTKGCLRTEGMGGRGAYALGAGGAGEG